MNNEIELIVLLQGNYFVLRILKDKQAEVITILSAIIENKKKLKNKVYCLGLSYFKGESLIGWYFRDIMPSQIEQVTKFLDKKIPDKDEGDSWKE